MISCNKDKKVVTPNVDNVLIDGKQIIEESGYGSFALNKKYFVGLKNMLLTCNFMSEIFVCSHAFILQISEYGSHFTFNPGIKIASDLVNVSSGN